jgi:LysR family nitrogen assimilation transcriptional regulator
VPFILGHDMVLSAGPTEVRQIVEDAAARHSLNVKVAFEVRSIQAMKALVLRGVGVTVLPYGSVKEELLSRRLTGSRIAEPGLAWKLHLVLPGRRPPLLSQDASDRLLNFAIDRMMATLGPLARRI